MNINDMIAARLEVARLRIAAAKRRRAELALGRTACRGVDNNEQGDAR